MVFLLYAASDLSHMFPYLHLIPVSGWPVEFFSVQFIGHILLFNVMVGIIVGIQISLFTLLTRRIGMDILQMARYRIGLSVFHHLKGFINRKI